MPRPLRIGVNALYLIPGGVGGTEIYLRNLLAAMSAADPRDEFFIFVNQETTDLVPEASNFHTIPCPVRAARRPQRLIWEQLGLPRRASRLGLDVLFSPGFTSPALCRIPKVTVIHDLQHKSRPQNFRPLELLAWRVSVWASARFSQAVVTVSESSRRDVIEVYGLPQERVHTIHHGVEEALFAAPADRSQTGLDEWPYLLTISTVHPHKNWSRWLEAYRMLAAEGWPHHLVIAGLGGKFSRELERIRENPPLADRVHITGWVPRPRLRAILQHAAALVFPSTFEGFGMPVLEAMAAGVPVACSDIPPLREVAADAAVYFDPYSVDSIAAAVRLVLGDAAQRGEQIARGRDRARSFTWTRAAEQTLAVLRQAATTKRRPPVSTTGSRAPLL